ncbi:LysR family transcriptional regulator [Bacillus sp. Xin]|uniref:LysR substrate-binding domain-containing protein n=1 Tax=unclassified Bacillus (in: firmicutes) TaxID=185979 RepID=UPI001572F1EF|nr:MULTISPECIES: LysR family transcriptional regulator [unclassified Bacillus (in: firmicutes)]MBC6976096.1 LysR family transcriptional regulator [Bacillus sp. Xin]MCI0766774.1 LysR family transcriptional regulator [Bacillus sp. TL12]NSW37278.1 LysR family transcriptional regulator [Bacillus sp. Xin1]
MEIKELKTFKMIIQEGTFSLAAKKLNYAQSTVTTHIKKLEKELGFLLFERGWDARLTDEGTLFAEEVDHLLMHWDYSVSQAQRISNEEKGTVRVGLLDSIAEKLIPPLLKYLNAEKPYIHCDFVVGNTALLSQMVDQNKIDFAVCGNNKNISDVKFTPLYNEQIEFIVNNPHHPLLQKESVEVSDIIDYPILIGENSCYYYQSVNAFLLENNVSFKKVYNCSALHLIPQMIFGEMIGIIPKGTNLKEENISFKVKGFDPEMPIGLCISSKKRDYLSHTKQQLMKQIELLF